MNPVFEKKIILTIPETKDGTEPPFAQKVLEEEIQITGPAGKYNLLATLERGGDSHGRKSHVQRH